MTNVIDVRTANAGVFRTSASPAGGAAFSTVKHYYEIPLSLDDAVLGQRLFARQMRIGLGLFWLMLVIAIEATAFGVVSLQPETAADRYPVVMVR